MGLGIREDLEDGVYDEEQPVDTDNASPASATLRALRKALHVAFLAILLGTAGTVLGVWNLLDDESSSTSSVGERDANGVGDGAGNPDDPATPVYKYSLTMDAIVARQRLLCGVPSTTMPGFAFTENTATRQSTGLDVDLCAAVAGALLGDADAYEMVALPGTTRWSELQAGTVDLVLHSTHTAERDVAEASTGVGFTFSQPYLYDALVLGGSPPFLPCANDGDTTTALCTDVRVCVQQGTTHEAIVVKLFPEHHILVPDQATLYSSFRAGVCNVVASEGFGISPQAMARSGAPVGADYARSDRQLSKEPLAIATRQDDARWSDLVEWVLQALWEAEETGVTQATASDMPTTTVFGAGLEQIFQRTVGARGNYGEIYAKNLEAIEPRGGMNRINGGDTGLLYSFPWGDTSADGPQIEVVSSTVAAMKARGYLSCGISLRKGFAEFDSITRTWAGFDIDLCRALAAAIFDGVDHVVFVDLPAAQRFQVLDQERVDVLARLTTWTLARDVLEPSIGKGLTFASPYFYDGVTFGGIPPYLQCAENQDIFSPECQDLRFCILQGTTGFRTVAELFREAYISPRLTFTDIIDGLNDGSCNAVAGGFHDVAIESIRERGYDGPYEVGVKRYSKDPLALTTREDDPAWSDLVRWVYWSLVYAEEENIQAVNATLMPRTTLFGPLRTNLFYHAVNAVGSYGEVYDRNFGSLIPRGGVHAINENGPAMVSLPGF